MMKVCIITGASSGIGRAAAENMLKLGYRVYGISRHGGGIDGAVSLCADVTDEQEIIKAVNTVMAESGRIDVLINNAGFGISGAAEFTETEDAERQFNVNFFGAVRMCRAVLPIMRKQGFGRIVNIGSVAGDIAIPFQSFYSAAKAALCSYTLALINEVREFNITAVCIEPGDIRTGFTAARHKNTCGDDIYNGRISRSVEKMEKDEQTGMSPETVGKYIAKIASKQSSKPVLIIGAQYKAVGLLKKLLPVRLTNRIVGAIYAK